MNGSVKTYLLCMQPRCPQRKQLSANILPLCSSFAGPRTYWKELADESRRSKQISTDLATFELGSSARNQVKESKRFQNPILSNSEHQRGVCSLFLTGRAAKFPFYIHHNDSVDESVKGMSTVSELLHCETYCRRVRFDSRTNSRVDRVAATQPIPCSPLTSRDLNHWQPKPTCLNWQRFCHPAA